MRGSLNPLRMLATIGCLWCMGSGDAHGQSETLRNYISGFRINFREFELATGQRWQKLTVAQIPAVQEELNLGDTKREQLNTVIDEAGSYMRNGGEPGVERKPPMSRDEATAFRETLVNDLVKRFEPKVDELLDDVQERRLEQLVVQAQGVDSLTRSDIATKIGLTDQQLLAVSETNEKHRLESQELRQIRITDPKLFRDRMVKLADVETRRKKALQELLTDAQRNRLTELGGAPFDTSWFNVQDNVMGPSR